MPGDLERYETIPQGALAGQEDPGECATSDLVQKGETKELVPRFRPRSGLVVWDIVLTEAQQASDEDEQLQRPLQRGKPPRKLLRVDGLAAAKSFLILVTGQVQDDRLVLLQLRMLLQGLGHIGRPTATPLPLDL